MNYYFKACVFLSFFLLLFSFYPFLSGFSSSNIGNKTFDIANSYGQNQSLSGWINISVNNEDFNSAIIASYLPSSYSKNISLNFLLSLNPSVAYTCSSNNCNMTYSVSGIGLDSLAFNLNRNFSKTVGFKLNSPSLASVLNASIKISSNSIKSCTNPLSIVLFDQTTDKFIWTSYKSSNDFECGTDLYGGYEPSYKDSNPASITSSEFCNIVNLSVFPAIKLGANLSGSGNANFSMSLISLSEDFIFDKSCSFSMTSSGDGNCVINSSSSSEGEYIVCIKKISGAEYTINFDKHDARGYWRAESFDNKYDWEIYTRSASFAALGEFYLNSTTVSNFPTRIYNYLQEYYGTDLNCSLGCVLPISFISGMDNHALNISSVSIRYPSGPSIINENKVYETSLIPSKISFPFSIFYLNSSGLSVPLNSGIYNLSLYFNNQFILKKQIQVLSLPIIDSLSLSEVPAALNSTFRVYYSGNATSFVWNFGDNSSSVETSSNLVTYRYAEIGEYSLSVTAKNSNGQTSKNFTIRVTSPKNYLNSTLLGYKTRVSNLQSQISGFPVFVKNYISDYFNLTGTDIRLTGLLMDYNSAGNDSDKYISIANSLQGINLPILINMTQRSSGKYLFNPSIVSSSLIKNISAEESSVSPGAIENATFEWFLQNLDVSGDLITYGYSFGNSSIPLVSYANFNVIPLAGSKDIFLVVNRLPSNVEFNQASGVSSYSNSEVLSTNIPPAGKNLEVLISGSVLFLDMPVYFTPKLSELNVIGDFGSCNFNGKCESGEDNDNCSSDCKSYKRAWIWIILALFFVFCLYIAAQEWYKRRYENYLFKDKNDLYNLTHFIDNAKTQGLDKNQIFDKLGEKDWSGEQINFAYKKYFGLRTGMYEIPIFKFLENRKVQKEIEYRKNLGINPNIVPRPVRPFMQKPLNMQPPKNINGLNSANSNKQNFQSNPKK